MFGTGHEFDRRASDHFERLRQVGVLVVHLASEFFDGCTQLSFEPRRTRAANILTGVHHFMVAPNRRSCGLRYHIRGYCPR